jgi:hypothetical protein
MVAEYETAMTPSSPVIAAIVVLILLGGCATAPPAPPAVDVSGTWRGRSVFVSGAWECEWRLEQRGTAVTGDVTRAANPPTRLTGTVEGNTLNVKYEGEPTSVELIVTGDEMKGDGYGRAGLRGMWTLRRQRP